MAQAALAVLVAVCLAGQALAAGWVGTKIDATKLAFKPAGVVYYYPGKRFQTFVCTALGGGQLFSIDLIGGKYTVKLEDYGQGYPTSATNYALDLNTGKLTITGYAVSVVVDLVQLSKKPGSPVEELNVIGFNTRKVATTALKSLIREAKKYQAPNKLVPCLPDSLNFADTLKNLETYLTGINAKVAKP